MIAAIELQIENLNARLASPLPLDLVRDGKDKRVVISGELGSHGL